MKYVVIGASAAGVSGIRELRKLDKSCEIVLISKDKDIYSRCILHRYLGGERSLEKLSKGRTTLTIAHRLTTIQNADRIIVLGKNGIEEEGNHESLLASKGTYYRLWNGITDED